MGWQDRDYARGAPPHGPVYRTVMPGRRGSQSIVTRLIIINVVVFVLGVVFPPVRDFLSGYVTPAPFGGVIPRYGIAELWAEGVIHGQVWRLFTAQYLHADTWHLLLNMLVLHFLGRPLEQRWSGRKFFAVYTLCGLAGNLFYTALAAAGWIPSWMQAVGASGCIYGLLGIVAVLFPHATVWVYFLFPIKIRTAALVFGGLAVLSIWQKGSNYGGEACHLAGMVFGVWWAMKGDAWWTYRGSAWWRRVRGRFGGKARGVGQPGGGGFAAKIAQRREDEETIDRILKKVYEGGIHSLTEGEKRALQAATERQKQREAEAGRVDRL